MFILINLQPILEIITNGLIAIFGVFVGWLLPKFDELKKIQVYKSNWQFKVKKLLNNSTTDISNNENGNYFEFWANISIYNPSPRTKTIHRFFFILTMKDGAVYTFNADPGDPHGFINLFPTQSNLVLVKCFSSVQHELSWRNVAKREIQFQEVGKKKTRLSFDYLEPQEGNASQV